MMIITTITRRRAIVVVLVLIRWLGDHNKKYDGLQLHGVKYFCTLSSNQIIRVRCCCLERNKISCHSVGLVFMTMIFYFTVIVMLNELVKK